MLRSTFLVVTVCCAAGILAGCGSTDGAPATSGSGPVPVGDSHSPMPAPGTCHAGTHNGEPVPDQNCTPGAINPQVTPATMQDTICKSGWTKTVRPPTRVTGKMKVQSASSYGTDTGEKGEYDHLISLQLGGAPDDPRNLWVEPGKIPNPKDAVENKLNSAVCSGLIPLDIAQRAISGHVRAGGDWTTAIDDAGLRVANGKLCLREDPKRCASGRRGDDD